MAKIEADNMAKSINSKTKNLHVIIIAAYYSLFFLLADFDISVTASVIGLTSLLFFYFVFGIHYFLKCEINTPIIVLFISVMTILINIRSIDYLRTDPMYLYSMFIATISILYLQDDNKSRKYIMNILLFVAIISAFVAIFSKLFSEFYLSHIASKLSQSSYEYIKQLMRDGYSGVIGGYISLSIIYIVCGLAISMGKFLESKNKKYLLVSVILFIAIIFTNRRSELLASFLAILIMIFICANRNQRTLLLSIGLICIFALGILAILIWTNTLKYNGDNRLIQSVFALIKGEDISNGRLKLYETAWQLFCTKPIFGIGFGNFRKYGSQQIEQVSNVHNIYLQLLCETGVVGAVILLGALFYLTKKIFKNFKKAEKKNNFTSSFFSLYMMIFILIFGLFDNPVFQDTFWLLLCLIIACSFKNKDIKRGVL